MKKTFPGTLEISNVTKTYSGQKRPVLSDVSATVEPGQTLCVLGPSGCGKSTLLRLVAGLERVDRGTIGLGGTVCSRPGRTTVPERRGMNMVFQDYALWPHLRVRQIIGYGLTYGINRVGRDEREPKVKDLISLLQLEGLESRRPAELSGGQQQRVAIARCLATSPELLLFDEPLSNLDVQLRAEMRDELAALLTSLHKTSLYVTHDASEALAFADTIIVLHDGEIVQAGGPREVFSQPRSPWVAGLAGFSSTLHPESMRSVQGDTAVVDLGRELLSGRYCGVGKGPTEEHVAGITAHVHPGAARMTHSDDSGANVLSGLVKSCVFEGTSYRVRLQIGTNAIGQLVLIDRQPHPLGEGVKVRVDAEQVLIFG